jgi:KUP system potassium uptake protein
MAHGGGQAQGPRALLLGALGVVYGDIGTSPLYAIKECFHGSHAIEPTPENVYGALSLVLWTLIVLVTVKYLLVVLRADNEGEGGIMALMALVRPKLDPAPFTLGWVTVSLGLFGSALLYGDGVITPAISVLSAVEGLSLVTDAFTPWVLPITVGILFALFLVQKRGTAGIGAVFGPIMVVWFVVLGALGIGGIVHHPEILGAVFPWHAARFLANGGWHAFLVLGSVFLVATGGEALYADMGHFGRRPIRLAWFGIVLPGLVLNYFGQGALLLGGGHVAHPFFDLAPRAALVPLVVLATCATVIASQALISGAFSLTRQAIQLGYLPRLHVQHTSAHEIGQIYIGSVNWALFAACVGLVVGFGSASALAAAYGIAVAITMVITTLLLAVLARRRWGWSLPLVCSVTGVFLFVEGCFLAANSTKIADGGWFPLVLGVVVFTLLSTWKEGRRLLGLRLREEMPLPSEFAAVLEKYRPVRVPGVAVFLTSATDRLPPAVCRNVEHNRVLHEIVVLLTIVTEAVPFVTSDRRVTVERTEHGFWRVIGRYGFMEEPDVPDLLHKSVVHGLSVDTDTCTYFVGRETVLPSDRPGMALWRESLFALITRNAQKVSAYYKIRPTQVIEIGSEIEI